MRFLADLHIHSKLSPCAADEMTPPQVVQTALEQGLQLIAICDHNSALNVRAFQLAAGDSLQVIAGMEITTAEEVHVVGLFPCADAALEVDRVVRASLSEVEGDYYQFFGEQWQLGPDGERLGLEAKALATATPFSLNEVVGLIHAHAGLAIAAHIDRRSFSVLSQLGIFPLEAGFDGVEVTMRVATGSNPWKQYEKLGLPMLTSSDSHFLHELGSGKTALEAEEASFDALAQALRREGGCWIGRA